jgi:tetratricopeptide (TPR) repeat protein
MHSEPIRRAVLLIPLLALACAPRQAADRSGPNDVGPAGQGDLRAPLLDNLGDHHHEVSTDDPMVQRLFDQGMVMHFGFNHAEAVRSFEEAARLDPECGICWMGVALSLGPNINAPMDPDDYARAFEASRRALAVAGDETPREQAYIEAVAARYAEDPPKDRTSLDEAYAEAMVKVSERYPDDVDAASLYAEALMVLHPWDYWNKDGTPKAWTPEIVSTLEGVLDEAPDHPFANHLYIHAVEASKTPERGLESARRLADLVPGAGHLVHMPAHIYIRTGDYHEASRANERAIAADEAYLEQVRAQGLYPLAYYPHNYHFLWATTTLEGRSEDAIAAARALAERSDRDKMREPSYATLQHYLVTPYYALVSFGRWPAILDEPPPPKDLLYPSAVWHYARGMALASRGEVDAAEQDLRFVSEAASNPALAEVTIWGINSTQSLVEIAAELLGARLAEARGDQAQCLAHLRRAVELEDALNYDEPPPWGPATRRYLGAALLDAGQPEAAERVYREDLATFPNNGWSLFGLAQSLRAQGRDAEADEVQARFEQAWKHADVTLTASAF